VAAVEVFQYPVIEEGSVPVWDGVAIAPAGREGNIATEASPELESRQSAAGNSVQGEDRGAHEDARESFEKGWQQGIFEGRRMEREAHADAQSAAVKMFHEQAAALASEFAREREQFAQRMEHEIVRLALAIAARILRRETQMDPLLLTGAVRVALGQLSKSTRVRLRVPPSDLELWSETVTHMPNLAVRPEVLSCEGMRSGECVVETEIGSLDLGVRAQLGEIERGFFDLATAHPVNAFASDRVLRLQEELNGQPA
jgi:flagellar assembly protein FliH